MATANQVIGALKWNAIGRLSAQAITWTITLVVMRLLVPGDYGLMGLATIVTGFLALFNHLGAIPALIQKPEIDDTLIRQVFGLLLVSNLVLYGIVFAGAPYFAAFFGQSRLLEILPVSGIVLILGALAAVPNALLQRELKFKSISLIELASTVTASLAVLFLAVLGFGVWALVFGPLVRWTLNSILLLVVTRFRMMPKFNFIGLGAVLSFGLKVSAAQIIWYISNNFDSFLIGRVLGKEALGLYSVAYDLALLPTTKIISLSNQIAFAAYARAQNERAKVTRYFQESITLSSLVFFPACWGMSAIADDLVTVMLGPKWQSAAIVLRIVALGVPYRAFVMLMDPLVTGIGRPGVSLRNTITSVIVIPTGMAAGIYWGLTGLCIGALIAVVIGATINLNRNLRLLEMSYSQFMELLLPSMLAAALMYAAVLIAHSGPFAGISPSVRLPLETGLGAITYGMLTLVLNRPAAMRSLRLIREFR